MLMICIQIFVVPWWGLELGSLTPKADDDNHTTFCRFQDRVSYQRHMAEEHSSGDHPFFCQKCSVYLKCEAAFKSHNSKLHLERRDKLFYCRECDETFGCKLKHSRHIVTHRTWSSDESGMQCKVCGKVFSKNQTLPFHKHLATHDDDELVEVNRFRMGRFYNIFFLSYLILVIMALYLWLSPCNRFTNVHVNIC